MGDKDLGNRNLNRSLPDDLHCTIHHTHNSGCLDARKCPRIQDQIRLMLPVAKLLQNFFRTVRILSSMNIRGSCTERRSGFLSKHHRKRKGRDADAECAFREMREHIPLKWENNCERTRKILLCEFHRLLVPYHPFLSRFDGKKESTYGKIVRTILQLI